MAQRIEIVGKRFGRLMVMGLEPHTFPSGKTYYRYLCRCDCGTEKWFHRPTLMQGHAKSCGCWRRECNRVEMAGGKFGRLTVIREIPRAARLRRIFVCRCKCGRQVRVIGENLRSGNTRSCGCYRDERIHTAPLKHGEAIKPQSAEYITWTSIIGRCENPNQENYQRYGGRGIKMCRKWRLSFPAFLKDMGRKPTPKHSIDRRDVDGDYTPKNCRWVTDDIQRANKRPRKRK